MSFQDDFSQSGLSAEGYIRLIWKETEFDEENFSDIDFFDDFDVIKERVVEMIDTEMDEVTPFRKNMYRTFLAQLEDTVAQRDTFDQWLRAVNAFIELDEEKRKYVARYMTRVLRGELCNVYRSLQEAPRLLKEHRASVWDQYKLQLEKLCASMQIN